MTKARDLSQVPNASLGFKNRIINGAMQIDQRNAGASVSVASAVFGYLSVDRWRVNNNTDGAITLQRSTIAPTGFSNSLLATVTTADTSLGAPQFCFIQQPIEGFNVSDFGFGTTNAATITVSFWIRSSVTGTMGGSLTNGAVNRSYPFTYIVNNANTWEYKTVTIAGDVTGTWATDNSSGMSVFFSLGCGTSNSGTAGSWAGSQLLSVTGATSVVGTNGATFYITGVQLEKGSTATSFDYRPYGTELALCERYYQTYSATTASSFSPMHRYLDANNEYFGSFIFPVTMRTTPTASVTATQVHKPGVRYDSAATGAAPITEKHSTIVATPSTNDSTCRMLWFSNGLVTLTAEL